MMARGLKNFRVAQVIHREVDLQYPKQNRYTLTSFCM